jgi:hypothetical protein
VILQVDTCTVARRRCGSRPTTHAQQTYTSAIATVKYYKVKNKNTSIQSAPTSAVNKKSGSFQSRSTVFIAGLYFE